MIQLQLTASIFEEVCASLEKLAFIKKLPNGKYRVLSEKGKNLGTYNSREEAKNRLRQVEYFKHKKASQDLTYSRTMRALKGEKELIKIFRETYKKYFDDALLNNEENPETIALEKAVNAVNDKDDEILKKANPIPVGDPAAAGKSIADLCKFLMQKISEETRATSIINLKNKLQKLNENELAQKKMPSSSAIGQSLSLVKNLLFSHSPEYIRAVLNNIMANL